MSYNSYSLVTCEYEQNANMDSVVIEMQQKIDQVKAGWKDGVGTPTIMKINPDMLPIMMTAVDMDGKASRKSQTLWKTHLSLQLRVRRESHQ